MTSLLFTTLKDRKTTLDIPDNTTDLVNGLFLTINTTVKDFDYASAYELLPQVVEKLYKCVELKPYSLKPHTKVPSVKDIDFISISGQLLVVCSIGLNRNGEKTHLHLWIYNIHSFNHDYQSFRKNLTKELQSIKGISRRNEFSIKLVPVSDPIDTQARQSDCNNQVIVDYITAKEYDTLMNYFATKNNKNFIYFY